MSTVFPSGGALPARVPPKVFADVPSARELEEAKRAVQDMRKSRNSMTLGLILMAGMLIAAAAFIVFLIVQPKPEAPPVDPKNDPAQLNQQITDLQATLKTSRENLAMAQEQLKPFDGIPEAQAQYAKLSNEIGGIVADTETYGNIKQRTIANRRNPTTDQWAVYERGVAKAGVPTWRGEDAGQVKASIQDQVNALSGLIEQIKATGPLPTVVVGPPPCVGPNC